MPIANIDRSLQAGILADLKETWRQQIPVFRKQQEKLLKYLPDSNIRNATWAWKESVPFPQYWPYGTGRKAQAFRDRYLTLGKYNYELTIPWSRWDEEDDQLGDLRSHIQIAVQRYGQLPDVLISEYFNNVADLNPSILNAFDGAALFSTVDGDGADRLGVSGGNIITGSGLTPDGIIHDFAQVQQRALSFIDPTAGKPILSPEEADFSKMFAIVPNSANEVFQKTAQSEYLKISGENIVSESNWLKGIFEWQTNPYLTDTSDWYVVLEHSFWKPFVFREPKNVESIIADMQNSDSARETGEYKLHTHVRCALGPWFPGVIFKVNN
ncbi:MAG: hypothetical protein DRI56_03255 [Chloroflexota bacterium]|nr:MAG: hypothetical protein DRI56_03255 [Chloroflexota bacterium]